MMTGLIIRKQLKELFASKSDLVFLGIIVVACGIVAPLFSNMTFAILSPMLTATFLAQMSPSLFVEEKDNRSLETLVTLPVGMKQIIYGKVLGLFFVSLLLFWLSLGLGLLISFLRFGSVIFTWEQALIYMALVPLCFWAFAWLSAYVSFKSKDSGICALTLTFVSILYGALPILLFVFLLGRIDTVVNWLFLSFRVDLVRIVFVYAFVTMAAFILLRILIGKYFDKARIFGLLRN